ncbi:carbohydrate porin [Frateuria aurantia]
MTKHHGLGHRVAEIGASVLLLASLHPTSVLATDADEEREAREAQSPTETSRGGEGFQNRLKNRGVAVHADFVTEAFGVPSGGLKQGARAAGQVRLSADFDLGKLFGIQGGTLHMMIGDRFGRGVSTDLVGNRLPIQEVYSSQFVKLTELSYEQRLFSDHLDVKLGYWAMGNNFGGLSVLCDFVNAAFCAHPLTFSGNSGWGNYPNSRLGTTLQWNFNPSVNVTVGGFEVNPDFSTQSHAWSLDPRGSQGAIFPAQLELKTGHGLGPEGYPGDYRFGIYYDNSRNALKDGEGERRGRAGYFFVGTQQVYHEPGYPARGLSVFGQFTSAQRSTAQIASWIGAGLIYTGTFYGRDQDTVGLGYIRAKINKQLTVADLAQLQPGSTAFDTVEGLPDAESMLELEYGFQVTRYLIVRPDFQYIMDPGVYSYRHIPNAFAAGFQIKMVF